MTKLRITLRYFDGCPNWMVAKARIEDAMKQVGLTEELTLEQVETAREADGLGFHGSPTVLINGRDPFDATGPTGLSCRVYRADAGVEGAPSVAQLAASLKETA